MDQQGYTGLAIGKMGEPDALVLWATLAHRTMQVTNEANPPLACLVPPREEGLANGLKCLLKSASPILH